MINLNVVIIMRWIREEVEAVFDYGFTDLKLAIGNDEFDESLADCRIHLFSAVNVIPKLGCALIVGSTDRPHRSSH